MKISIIIVSYNTSALLRECLKSVFAHLSGSGAEVFVVDNDSRDDSTAVVRDEFPEVKLIANEENVGFAAANNQAYAQATGEYIFLVNPDLRVDSDAFSVTIDFMEGNERCGVCGGKLLNERGGLEPSARKFPGAFSKLCTLSGLGDRFQGIRLISGHDYKWFDHKSAMEVDWVPGAFVCFRRKMLEEIGFFDERFYLYFEETDVCLRAKKKGWQVYFIPGAEVMHVGGACSKVRKELKFDAGGSQVMKFRMRSECLYFRKNYSRVSVLANMGVEWVWHFLRQLFNFRNDEVSQSKRQYSLAIMKEVERALKDTKWGDVCPSKPWK